MDAGGLDISGISFVDDVTWIAAGSSAQEVVRKLEGAAARAVRWGCNNAMTFEISKVEVILFSKALEGKDKCGS